jgi:FkbM family methyltransferase
MGAVYEMRRFATKQLKRSPILFDAARSATRMLGSQTMVSRVLTEASGRLAEINFIQIGSNDGLSGDPLREFVVSNPKWRGAFVEPVPQLFAQLRRNYSYLGRKELHFFNVAVSADTEPKQLWKIKDAFLHEFPFYAPQLGSFDRNHIRKHFPEFSDLDSRLEAIDVGCKTYEQIQAEASLSTVDVLHLDVEGHEYAILQSIDFLRSRPLILIFEIKHMPTRDRESLFQRLQNAGYAIELDETDCVATLSEPSAMTAGQRVGV